ncbi:MAG: prolipoprotein diacylglyceryl transferase [Dehalococcoidia bacterium]|nr:prolipoprotein diacylglyceryl transferase [Dehalococcoidia bacterium]
MITIDLNPNIATIGAFTLAWHGVFSAVAIIVGIWLTLRLLRGTDISEDDAYTLALWSVIGGIVGARLFHVIDAWDLYSKNPIQILMINEGGLSIYGAIIVGTLAAIVTMLIKHINVGRFLDAGAPGLVLGQAIGRIGDVINGEHHGLPTDWPIGVRYVNPDTLGEPGKVVHLSVGYEMIWDIIVLAVLLRLRGRLPKDGMVFALYMALYAFGRFFITFARVDAKVVLGLSQAQVIALIMLVVSVPLTVWLGTRSCREQPAVVKTAS